MGPARKLKIRGRLGKYRVEKRLAQGGFADVFQAYDTVEGIRVALKVPQPEILTPAILEDFKKEVRVTARLDHRNILPIKNASYIDGHFVIACHLGQGTLGDRLRKRLSLEKAFLYAEQILAALAYAHAHRVLHCDVKPENILLFPGDHLRLTDFGLAKISVRTLMASGSGTLGYMAPEQAMGRPSARSDVFSVGLVLHRMFAGVLPDWPYQWPPPRHELARRRLHPDLLELLRRSLEVEPKKRFEDAQQMQRALARIKLRALAFKAGKRRSRPSTNGSSQPDWREVRLRQFLKRYKQVLDSTQTCSRCQGPVSEGMLACPWCGRSRATVDPAETRHPANCPRCKRGVKLDWRFCAWCYGPGIGPLSTRRWSDKRYTARCANESCPRRELMPFMRYCPWCRTKVRRPWPIPGKKDRCPSCHWGALTEYWTTCPWCTRPLSKPPTRFRRA